MEVRSDHYKQFAFVCHMVLHGLRPGKLLPLLLSCPSAGRCRRLQDFAQTCSPWIHNSKQPVLTVMLLLYIFTVIAFNFVRKFYVQEEDDEIDKKYHDMLTCFIFHLYRGVRAGGGIGDEIDLLPCLRRRSSLLHHI